MLKLSKWNRNMVEPFFKSSKSLWYGNSVAKLILVQFASAPASSTLDVKFPFVKYAVKVWAVLFARVMFPGLTVAFVKLFNPRVKLAWVVSVIFPTNGLD